MDDPLLNIYSFKFNKVYIFWHEIKNLNLVFCTGWNNDYKLASGGVIVRIFLIFDNNSINNKATTLCLHT